MVAFGTVNVPSPFRRKANVTAFGTAAPATTLKPVAPKT
jgi:hypothetical protein